MSVDILGTSCDQYAEARFNKSLRPRKPEGSLGRTARDVHLDSHTAPELRVQKCDPALDLELSHLYFELV